MSQYPGSGKGCFQPREVDRLPGAAARVGARIKVQNELASREIRKRHGSAAVPQEPESWRLDAQARRGIASPRSAA